MDRIVVANTPAIIRHGFAPYLLFFDKLSIPDIKYIDFALEATKLEFDLNNKAIPSERGEQYLGLGYYLTEFSNDLPRNSSIFGIVENFLDTIQDLRQKNLIIDPFLESNTRFSLNPAGGAWSEYIQLMDVERIKSALSLNTVDKFEVTLHKFTNTGIQFADIPNDFSKYDVIELILKSLPIPSKQISIDEILSFKDDNDVKTDLARFRMWIAKMVNVHDNLAEIEDEYIALYHSYKKSLDRLCKQHSNTGIGVVMGVTANIIDNLSQLKLGSAVKSLFDYRTARLKYDETVANLKGNELEYIRKLESLFS